MRHKKAGKQLSRNSSHRKALLRNIVTSLFKYERIETTDAKAKSLRPIAEKMITLAKRGDLHARRQALSYMQDKAVTHKLFDEIKDRYIDRQGGYLRIVKKGIRKGDGAPVSIVQLISQDDEKKPEKKKSKKRKSSKEPVLTPQKEVVSSTEDEPQAESPSDHPDDTAAEIKQESSNAVPQTETPSADDAEGEPKEENK